MTTPRIEEMIEEFKEKFGLYELRYVEHGKESIERIMGTKIIQDWLRTTLTEAHQAGKNAGIDKAVERIYERKGLDDPKCWHGKNWKDCKAEQCELRAINDTIKALQDNK